MLTRLIRIFRPLTGAWVRVHTASGAPSIEGVYVRRRAGYLFIDTPTLLPDQGDDRKMGGQVAIPLERVVMVQVMPS